MPIASGSQIRRSPGVERPADHQARSRRTRRHWSGSSPARCGAVPKMSALRACTATSAPRPPVAAETHPPRRITFVSALRGPAGLPHIGDFRQDAARCGIRAPDPEAAAAIGETLRAIGYDDEAIEERLGEDGIAAEGGEALVHALRLDADELGEAIRLLLLARPVSRSSFGAGPRARAARARDRGRRAARPARAHRPDRRRVPRRSTRSRTATTTRPGWVASFTPTAYWLASLTLRRRVRARGRHRNGQRRARAARRPPRGSRHRDRRQPARAAVHGDQRRPERARQRRDAARQPLRAGRRRDVRSHHLQRART